jgi:hypothetical protein
MRSFAVAPRVATAAVPKIQSFQAVRFYSAGGALNREEVEGRIMSLLKGFDKVRIISEMAMDSPRGSPPNCRSDKPVTNHLLRSTMSPTYVSIIDRFRIFT